MTRLIDKTVDILSFQVQTEPAVMSLLEVVWSYSDWILVAALLMGAIYTLGTWNYDYFSKQNIPYVKPIPFLGNMAPVFFGKTSNTHNVNRLYWSHRGQRVTGTFHYGQPSTYINDPELIKTIMIKDFDHFTDHHFGVSPDRDELFTETLILLRGFALATPVLMDSIWLKERSKTSIRLRVSYILVCVLVVNSTVTGQCHIQILRAVQHPSHEMTDQRQRWREMRTLLTQTFTSSKMKNMFGLVLNCGQQMAEFLEGKLSKHDNNVCTLEMKDFFSRYANDIIATSAFGVSVDSFNNPKNEFYLVGKQLTNFKSWRLLWLKIPFLAPSVSKFIYELVDDTLRTRERKGIIRPDMIHLLMQARKGELEEATEDGVDTSNNDLTDKDIAAQVTQFFFAGFDTSSNLLSFSSYLLAVHKEVQGRLQEEIDTMLIKSGGKILYEELQAQKYLDMVVSEVLRIYPPFDSIDRMCTKPYTIPASGDQPAVTFRKGDMLEFPFYGIQRDEEFFPDPDRFDPERFSDENKHKIKPFTFLAFGAGPRNCIGNRFALMSAKIALAVLLSKFNFKVVDKTSIPIRLSNKLASLDPKGGIWLGLELRNK
uniref:(California timema) hypothetical protein n=1 Tax=Timema californicum TaxID=61474 RepID=A0A7R9PAZ5_TIMCA|nr:unnamed protein product [Timema californicum]